MATWQKMGLLALAAAMLPASMAAAQDNEVVAISAIDMGWRPPEGVEWDAVFPQAPRRHFGITAGEGFATHATFDQPACQENEEAASDG